MGEKEMIIDLSHEAQETIQFNFKVMYNRN